MRCVCTLTFLPLSLALGILQSVDVSFKNRGDLPKRRGQCSAVSFWMIEDSECAAMMKRLLWLFGSIQAQRPLGVSVMKLEMCAPSVRENLENHELFCVRYIHIQYFCFVIRDRCIYMSVPYSSRIKASWRDDFLLCSTYSATSASLCGLTGRRAVLCAALWSQRRSTNGETEQHPHTCRFTDWLWYWY